jgi:5-methylcytosine-specific restriction endonuclease McrA
MSTKAGVAQSVRRVIFRRDNYTCKECGLTGWEQRFPRGGFGYYTDVPGVYLSIDHIVARSRGGSNEPGNLRVLCTTCNTRKGVKSVQCEAA